MTPAAKVVLAGAVVLFVAGCLPADVQHRHHRALYAALVVGLVAVAGGAAVWLGGWA